MKYLCTECRYVIDEAFWDAAEDLEWWNTVTDETPCPVCDEIGSFHAIEEEVHYIQDLEQLDNMESDHLPQVFSRGGKIHVVVGEEPHPMGENHRIGSVWLYDEYGDLVEEKFLQVDEEPKVEFDDENFGEYEIRVKCSQHGIWGLKIEEE